MWSSTSESYDIWGVVKRKFNILESYDIWNILAWLADDQYDVGNCNQTEHPIYYIYRCDLRYMKGGVVKSNYTILLSYDTWNTTAWLSDDEYL